jgi:LysM domain-containing protein
MSSQGAGPKPIGLIFLPALLGMGLAGCGTTQRAGVTPPSNAAAQGDPNWRGREEVRDAIALLNRGEAVAARAKLMGVLRRQPGDDVARRLLQQIDTDPRELLGRENYSYTLRAGETLSTVAQRALGNPMLFYALARYNNIAVPESVAPGQTILVPGRPRPRRRDPSRAQRPRDPCRRPRRPRRDRRFAPARRPRPHGCAPRGWRR